MKNDELLHKTQEELDKCKESYLRLRIFLEKLISEMSKLTGEVDNIMSGRDR
tara:strand:+ start:886 stop:1041 length:156 start_codon:yes stop_codon:yes gene_type:complete